MSGAKVFLGVALGVALALLVFGYFNWWRPNAHLRDLSWLEGASEAQILAESRKVLRLPLGNHHDASLFVDAYGGPESVPDLITCLRWLPDTEPGGIMSCDKAHCLEALQKITGANVGDNHRDWQVWWRSNHAKPPNPALQPAPPSRRG